MYMGLLSLQKKLEVKRRVQEAKTTEGLSFFLVCKGRRSLKVGLGCLASLKLHQMQARAHRAVRKATVSAS